MNSKRAQAILGIINNGRIYTQEELCRRLVEEGFEVTQATVSRDIGKLGITKAHDEKGHQYYSVKNDSLSSSGKYMRILKEGFVSADTAGNLLVIKTVSGLAMGVAAAVDAMAFAGMIGTIAGDDTIMCAVKTAKEADEIIKKIKFIVLQKKLET